MRNYLTLLLLATLTASANAQFGGGAGDGYDTQVGIANLQRLNRFGELYGGGQGDGYDQEAGTTGLQRLNRFAELYGGGQGDGYDQETGTAGLRRLNRFADLYGGGSGDGYDSQLGANFAVLPLTLLDFTATPDGKAVRLAWSTTDETNTDYFLVERSIDGRHFIQVGGLPAAGTATPGRTLTYELIDTEPKMGTSYYRLRMGDVDGTIRYSELRQVTIVGGDADGWDFNIYPNPNSGNRLFVDLLQAEGPATVSVLSSGGRTVYRRQFSNASDPLTIDLGARLPAGAYTLLVRNGARSARSKLVIIRP